MKMTLLTTILIITTMQTVKKANSAPTRVKRAVFDIIPEVEDLRFEVGSRCRCPNDGDGVCVRDESLICRRTLILSEDSFLEMRGRNHARNARRRNRRKLRRLFRKWLREEE